jgi:hypothetical protein
MSSRTYGFNASKCFTTSCVVLQGNETNWKITKTMLKDIPAFIVMMLGASIRRKVSSSLMGHGIGRHSEKGETTPRDASSIHASRIYKHVCAADLLYLMERDVRALSQLLGNKTYINGA